jgi:hypothetical protein
MTWDTWIPRLRWKNNTKRDNSEYDTIPLGSIKGGGNFLTS